MSTLDPAEPRPAPSFKRRVYEWIEYGPDEHGHRPRIDWLDVGLIALILLNVVVVVVETVPGVEARYGRALAAFEAFSIVVFTVEYLLHLWVADLNPRFNRHRFPRLRFATSGMAIVDLLAIAPFYLGYFLDADLRFVLALRLLRMLRVLKIGRYSSAAGTLARVLKGKREELAVMFVVALITLVIASGLMYYAEHDKQPEKFASIPAAMWWAVITLTTIGYGDVYPETPLGRLLGGLIAVCGIGLVALPTAIVASGFAEEVARKRKERDDDAAAKEKEAAAAAGTSPAAVPTVTLCCPHCGKTVAAEIRAAAQAAPPA